MCPKKSNINLSVKAVLIDERILLQVKMRYNEFNIRCTSVLSEYNADSTLVSELRQEGEKWRN